MIPSPAGRICTRAALARLLPGELTPTPFALTDLFATDLDDYAEIIVGPGGRPVGFMTRGEDLSFTERARVALEQLGMPGAALAHHTALADWFGHRRGFFKVEWHRAEGSGDSGGSEPRAEPLAACYFRRRPAIADAVERLAGWGVAAGARELAADIAGVLEKQSIHFVAAAFRPDRPVLHKLYFSQLVAPDTRAQVTARIARVFDRFGMSGEAREHWRTQHERCLLAGESTLFVSVSFSGDAVTPSFKIDYPGVPADRAAAWLPAADRARAVADATCACELAGTRAVTYLGVRFFPDQRAPSLKFYCDVPRPAISATTRAP